MNVLSEGTRRWRRARKRGVSPIIATILLVAITVVLAAVLYVLVSGLTKSGASTPYTIGFVTNGGIGAGKNWSDSMSIIPSTGLTTTMFGLTVTNAATGAVYGLATAVGGTGCTLSAGHAAPASYTFSGTGCYGPSAAGWYGVLAASNNSIMGLYLASGGVGTWTYADGLTSIALSTSYTLYVLSFAQLNGNDYSISAYAVGTSSVSGSGTL